MSSQLDTVALVREMRDRQRERGRFDFQRVAVDSIMATGLILVGWVSVKAGLGLYGLSKTVADPAGAAEDSARGVEIASLRYNIKRLEGPAQGVGLLVPQKTREANLAKARVRLEELLAADKAVAESDEAEVPGIGMLKAADRMYGVYGPVLPMAVVGGNILMEVLRIRRERVVRTV